MINRLDQDNCQRKARDRFLRMAKVNAAKKTAAPSQRRWSGSEAERETEEEAVVSMRSVASSAQRDLLNFRQPSLDCWFQGLAE
jgi:hypothetical protein